MWISWDVSRPRYHTLAGHEADGNGGQDGPPGATRAGTFFLIVKGT